MNLVLLLLGSALMWLVLVGTLLGLRSVLPRRKTLGVALGRGHPCEPEDVGCQGTPVTFALGDGIESPGWLIETTSGPGVKHDPVRDVAKDANSTDRNVRPDNPAFNVLIVHGFSDSRFGALRWVPVMAEQIATGAHIVVFDQRGHGDAGGRWFRHGGDESADVGRVLEQAHSMLPDENDRPWILLGLSAGGGVSLRAAVELGEIQDQDAESDESGRRKRPRIAGVILDGAYRDWDAPLRQILMHRRYPRFLTLPLAGWVLRMAGADRPQRFDRAGWAARLPCPLLVLHGDEDALCPCDGAEAIARAAGNTATLAIFPGGHHLDLHHVDQDRYAQAVSAFLRDLATRVIN